MITPDQIDILNAARKILERADMDAMREGWEAENAQGGAHFGRVGEAAGNAADAIFSFLNVANNYGGVEMTYAQLHGREEVQA